MQRLPELVGAETGASRALLARPTSGRGDEDVVMTRASDSRVWNGDGREYVGCTTQGGFAELVGRVAHARNGPR